MPNPYLEWTDGVGLARLTSLAPRFNGWTPVAVPVGPTHVGLGSGIPYTFSFRTDFTVKFTLGQIAASQGAELSRLVLWLMTGGSITVATADNYGNVYTCYLREGATPQVTHDPDFIEYTLALELVNAAGLPMLALYHLAAFVVTPSIDYASLGWTFTRAAPAVETLGP